MAVSAVPASPASPINFLSRQCSQNTCKHDNTRDTVSFSLHHESPKYTHKCHTASTIPADSASIWITQQTIIEGASTAQFRVITEHSAVELVKLLALDDFLQFFTPLSFDNCHPFGKISLLTGLLRLAPYTTKHDSPEVRDTKNN